MGAGIEFFITVAEADIVLGAELKTGIIAY
jgi:hypothetical protein